MKILYITAAVIVFSGCLVDFQRSFNQPGDSSGSETHQASGNSPQASSSDSEQSVTYIGFTIQAGAFSEAGNAVRFAETLQAQGVDAYYFRGADGLYRVRFGDYSARAEAERRANALQNRGILESYYIVSPDQHPAADTAPGSDGRIRESIAASAERFLGTPYQWGGSSTSGIDCSGLAMVVYRLNGLELPRVASAQYDSGRRIKKNQLQKGDLVFFATAGGRAISHVGIYVGGGEFIHAPGQGRHVVQVTMNNSYWQNTYVGAATYL